MVTVNPSPSVGPPVKAFKLEVGSANGSAKQSLGSDRGASAMIRSVVLSKRLSALAKKAKLKKVRLSNEDKDEIAKLMLETPQLKKQLDTKTAFAASEGVWLENVSFKGKTTEPIVVLLSSDAPKHRSASIIQWTSDGSIAGGFTFQAN